MHLILYLKIHSVINCCLYLFEWSSCQSVQNMWLTLSSYMRFSSVKPRCKNILKNEFKICRCNTFCVIVSGAVEAEKKEALFQFVFQYVLVIVNKLGIIGALRVPCSWWCIQWKHFVSNLLPHSVDYDRERKNRPHNGFLVSHLFL